MGRYRFALVAVCTAGVLTAACSTTNQPTTEFRSPPRGATCDTASAKVLSFGRATARLNAEVALRHQVTDLQGYMFGAGLRRIQLVQKTNDCSAAGGGSFSSLYQCVARAQLCGR